MDAPLKDAAVIVLLRNPRDPEVYWARRAERVSVQPGFQSFLGGKLHPDDRRLEMEGIPDGPPRWMRACALRESLEEANVLAGVIGETRPEDLREARRALLEGATDLAALAQRYGWRFDGRKLEEAGRWMTPPFAPVRFDSWYFLAWQPPGQQPDVMPGELAWGEWVKPADALERWRRGEVTFVAPILSTLRELARGADGLAERLRAIPEAAARPIRRIEMKWGIVLCPQRVSTLPPATHTNCYIVGDRDVAIIDPGSGDPEQLEELFTLLELLAHDGRRPTCILVTHHHPDHVGGVEAVRARLQVPVFAHAETARTIAVDRTLADGDSVPLAGHVHDWTLRAIHTPGHARGHLCFFHEPTRSLFTGDHVVGVGTVVVDPPEGNMADYIASLERLIALPAETLFPAHGGPRGGAIVAMKALLAHRLRREAEVVAALRAGPATADDLLPKVYADTPKVLWSWAARSLAAHLEKLVDEGRVALADGRYRIA